MSGPGGPKYTVSIDEIETIRYLIECAFIYQHIEPDWAFDNWEAFHRVMSREQSEAVFFDVTPQQFKRCMRAAFILINGGECE
jgi:hypothetical protein